MRKRLLAILCVLALMVGIVAPVVPVSATAASTGSFKAGYARVDINPWEDPYDLDKDGSKGVIMQLPLRGSGNTIHRQSVSTLIDDNGSGAIDEKDGLFATCIVVTGTNGETVVMISAAVINGFERMVSDARASIVEALKEKGISISGDQIMISGTHTHNSIDVNHYSSANENSTTQYFLTDQANNVTEEYITGAQVYQNFEIWYPYLIDQLTNAAVTAFEDQDVATMKKGSIEASTAAGCVMNSVRQYSRVAKDGSVYVCGDNSNMGLTYSSYNAEIYEADDTMHVLQFSFSNGKDPIVLTNWRGHPSLNNKNGTRLNVSSDYINAFSYQLEQKNYRPIFIQGAAGNVNPASKVTGEYEWINAGFDADGDGIWEEGDALRGNTYGKKLAEVALSCLSNNMSTVAVGEVNTASTIYYADAKIWTEEVQYYAALTAEAYYDAGYDDAAPFVYPTTAINNSTFFASLDEDLQTKATSYKNSGDTYIIASTFHAADITGNHALADKNTTGKERVELCAFTLGEGVSFVTAPGELYDHYNSDLDWSDLSGCTTQAALYNKVNSFSNDWDNLIGSTYGTPFVMGYCNGSVGYFPNTLAYTYNDGSSYAATGSYEAHCTELAKGEGENLIATFDLILTYLTDGSSTLYDRHAYCPACEDTVYWQKMNADYNNDAHITGGDALGLGAGHYYLTEDITSAQKSIATGAEVCIDLNGYDFAGTNRAFLLQGNSTLNLMDTTEAADGIVSAVGGISATAGWYGGVVSVDAGSEMNLYSGTLSQTIKDGYYVARGGVLHVKGTFNMYGGAVTGGKTVRETIYDEDGTDKSAGSTYGGNIYIQGGTMTMSGGTISDGCCYGDRIGYGGNIALGNRTVGDVTIYSNVTISGGTISGGVASSSTEGKASYGGNIYVPTYNSLTVTGGTISGGTAATAGSSIYIASNAGVTLSGASDINQIYLYDYNVLTVTGRFTGSAELLYRTTPTATGTVIGKATEGAAIVTENLTINGSEWVPVVSGTDLVTGVAKTLCPFCNQMCIWNPVDSEYLSGNASSLATGHYRLSGNAASAQLTPATDAQICFDLNGYTFTGATRAFNIGSNSVVHIGDTSEKQTGTACGNGGSKYAGGVLYVNTATLHIHGGTFRQTENVTAAAGNKGGILGLYSGATVYMSGGSLVGPDITAATNSWGAAVHVRSGNAANTFNMTGGTIQGGSAKIGAAMYVEAGNTCNLSGGTITSGTATTKGSCVYVAGGNVNLSGDVKIADIYYEDSTVSADTLKIDTTNVAFTGIIGLSYGTTPTTGADIGNCLAGTNLAGASITLPEDMICSVSGTDLRAIAAGAAAIRDSECNCQYYPSFADTLAVYSYDEADPHSIVLYGDVDETVAISENINLDLNGYDMTAAVTNTGYTMYCYDSATDDYTVEDTAGYGKLPASVNAQPMDGYLMLQVEENGVKYNTFHRVDLDIQYLDLDVTNVEMYYESAYAGDEIVQDNVASYGVVVSITAEPKVVDGAFASGCLYTEATDYTSGSDLVEGARITNILSSENSTTTNKRYANTPMYGKAYIKLNDGTYVLGEMKTKTLRQTVEDLAKDPVASVSDEVIGLYNDFSAAMSNWNIAPIRKAAAEKVQAAEDAALKVLVIGNSHSLDSTNLLYDVFMEEGLPTGYDSLVLGAMYESGCKMYEHAAAVKNNTALYDYYKANSSSYAEEADHWYTTKDVTLLTALQDEQWDVVVIQEMNTYATTDANFRTGDMETVINYIDSKLAKDPIILWNLIWANPEIPEGYDSTNYKQSWIYKIAQPYSAYEKVVNEWEAFYASMDNDDQVMYSEIVRNYNAYVATNSNVDGALLSGTAIQQAKNWLMDNYGYSEVAAEQAMYRDYTHMGDYGRTMVAYLWYAQLMELVDGDNFDWANVAETGLKYTTVPKEIRHKNFRTEDLVLTEDQQNLIIDVITEVLKDDDYSVAKPVAEQ